MNGDPIPERRAARAAVTLLLLAAGIALLIFAARQLHLTWADVRDGFSKIGLWFAAIFALSLARFALRSYAWRALMPHPTALGPAIAATISGDALGNVTPLGLAASEPAKALYLRRHGSPAEMLASLTAENFFYTVSVAAYIILGAGAMLAFFPDQLPPPVRLAGTIVVVAMVGVLGAAAWLAWQQPALASSVLARVPIARLRALVEHVRSFELQTYGAAGHQGSRLATVASCDVGFHLLSFAECWLTFWLLTGATALLPALVLDALNRVINIVFKNLPLRAGVEEGGTAILAAAIGYPASGGFLLGLVRKVRVIVWAAVGLVLWMGNARQGRR
jgi:Lysylphosphatidylglycerol synthase TM region